MDAPRGARMRARRSTPRSTSLPTSSQPRDTNPPSTGVPPSPAGRHACGAAFGRPCRCAREGGAHGARARARGRVRAMSAPAPARLRRLRARLSATPLALAIGTCERAASPVLLTACALLPRCRQPQLREVGLDGHRALDISDTTGRRDVDTTVTRIRPSSRPRALPLGPGGEEPVPVKPVPVSRAR